MAEQETSEHRDACSQELPQQGDQATLGRCLALLGDCAFQRQQWQEAEGYFVRALAIFAQQKEELEAGQCLYHRDQWCEATILADLGAIRLRFGMSSQHILEGIQCLSLAYEIALRLDDQELVSDVLKAQTRLSRRYRRPRC